MTEALLILYLLVLYFRALPNSFSVFGDTVSALNNLLDQRMGLTEMHLILMISFIYF